MKALSFWVASMEEGRGCGEEDHDSVPAPLCGSVACEMGSEKRCVRRALSVKGNAWFHLYLRFP